MTTREDSGQSMNTSIANKRFHSLDVVRTILAISVATGHYFYWNNSSSWFPRSFYLSVDFFFVLSGFVLTQSIFSSRAHGLDDFILGFFKRRAARLLPLYYLLFIPSLFFSALWYGYWDPEFYMGISLLLLQSLGFDHGAKAIFSDSMIGIAWSVSVEFWIGLVFFPVVFMLRRKRSILSTFCIGISILCLLLISNFSPNGMDVNLQRFSQIFTFGSIRGLTGFALGALAYISYEKFGGIKVGLLVGFSLEMALICLSWYVLVRSGHNLKNEVLAPLFSACFVFLFAMGCGLTSRALNSDSLIILRDPSYSIYLIHPFIIALFRVFEIEFSSVNLVYYLPVLFFTSYFTCHFFEKPIASVFRKKVLP